MQSWGAITIHNLMLTSKKRIKQECYIGGVGGSSLLAGMNRADLDQFELREYVRLAGTPLLSLIVRLPSEILCKMKAMFCTLS